MALVEYLQVVKYSACSVTTIYWNMFLFRTRILGFVVSKQINLSS